MTAGDDRSCASSSTHYELVDLDTGYLRNIWPTLSWPRQDAALRVLSLGAGVQSSTLALMAARRDIGPMPDCAIFADTGAEPRRVYAYLDWLRDQLPYPVVVVRRDVPSLGEYQAASALLPQAGRSSIPLYTSEPAGMLAHQCSKEWKTRVVTREIRRRLGLEPRQRASSGIVIEQWIGISKDEIVRVKRAEASYIHNRHPLIEADMTRRDCLKWLDERQYPRPPKSSCIFCPFRDNAAWERMAQDEPEDFEDACRWDEAFRLGFAGMTGEAFVHRQRLPLRSVDFSRSADDDQALFTFAEPCEAGCGA